MNETIKEEIKSVYGGRVSFEPEQNVNYVTVDVFGDNSITHHLCYLAPDGEVYSSKTEYETK
jgi:hypothetical protein